MKKNLTLFAAALLLSVTAMAQFPYTLTTLTGQTYTQLTTGTSFNGNAQWYGQENYLVTMPFSFKYGNTSTTNFGLVYESAFATDTQNVISAFTITNATLIDRGVLGSQSLSPLRYSTTGTAPNRIFKFEMFNAGFYDEYAQYQTFKDSVDLQIWLYETSNVLEYHFGPSKVTHPLDYFSSNGYDNLGFFPTVDINNGPMGYYYYLTGSSTNPTLDSTSDFNNEPPGGLTTYPANGTVYRFAPKTSGVGKVAKTLDGITVYPTMAHGTVYIQNNSSKETTYQVLAANGALVGSGTLAHGNNAVDINTLAAGMYLVKAVNSEGQGVYKFAKD